MKKAFTLIELVVAVALLTLMLAFSGVIFSVSINSYRLVTANAEIMQKFRAITDQLNADFKGLRKDAPMLIWFELDQNTGRRYDQIMFFADGDFTSTQLYSFDVAFNAEVPSAVGLPVKGNVARIYYGQADLIDYTTYDYQIPPVEDYREFQTLARRQHILTADPDVINFEDISSVVNFQSSFVPFINIGEGRGNNRYEHDSISLAHWKLITNTIFNTQQYNDWIIRTCFDNGVGRPKLDLNNVRTLHMLMAEGVASFTIQWAYPFDITNPYPPPASIRQYRWWPSVNPDGNYFPDGTPDMTDSDFGAMMSAHLLAVYRFGICFNVAGITPLLLWYPHTFAENVYTDPNPPLPPGVFPTALKFTFTLYDSNGVIENGRVFTHIVYLDD